MSNVPVRDDPAYGRLATILARLGRVAVAFSGGVDSTFLAAVARDVVGADRTLLVTVVSELTSRKEREDCKHLATHLGVRHVVVEVSALGLPAFRENPPDRCYHCKQALFTAMLASVAECGDYRLCDGSNADDRADFRPGRRALAELDIASPLLVAEMTKADIRRLSRAMGLPTWDKPSYACLASRIPYGIPVTEGLLERVGGCEDVLHRLGFHASRVRHHGDVARIEVGPDDIAALAEVDLRQQIVEAFKTLGYRYVALDLEGYRTGSLNEVLSTGSVRKNMAASGHGTTETKQPGDA
jgi:pyridinium-3,5-biscarboxylic acid mononucleotide sulfurtransferase